MGDPDLLVAASAEAAYAEAARRFADVVGETVRVRGRARVVLAGGGTPRGLHAALLRAPYRAAVPWRDMGFWFGDERCVPPDAPASNLRMARESLLDHVPVPADAIEAIHGAWTPACAAADYDERLRRAGGGDVPSFDLVLLGLGGDGHTASLFPGADALLERERLAVAVRGPKPPPDRVTMTIPVFAAARHVLFLVVGGGKSEAVRRVLAPRPGDDVPPAAQVAAAARHVAWVLDREAAAALSAR